MSPGKADFLRKAQGLIVKGQWRKALEQFEYAYALDKADPAVTLRMGDLHAKLKEDGKAAMNYIKTASLFAEQGHVPKALATYKMALKIDGALAGVQEQIDALASSRNVARPLPGLHKAAAAPVGTTTAELFGDYVDLTDNTADKPSAVDGPKKSALLSGLSPEELSGLMGRMKLHTFGKGATVVREGEDGSSLYIIKNGRVRVVTRIKDEEVVLARLGEGDFFGEVSFLTGRPRTADIIAEEPSELMELCRDDLDSVIARHPDIEGVLRLFHENRVSDTLASLKAVSRDFLK